MGHFEKQYQKHKILVSTHAGDTTCRVRDSDILYFMYVSYLFGVVRARAQLSNRPLVEEKKIARTLAKLVAHQTMSKGFKEHGVSQASPSCLSLFYINTD